MALIHHGSMSHPWRALYTRMVHAPKLRGKLSQPEAHDSWSAEGMVTYKMMGMNL